MTTSSKTINSFKAIEQFNNTYFSAQVLQNKLKQEPVKLIYTIETMIGSLDIVADALKMLDKNGYVLVSLDKFEVEFTQDAGCIKAEFEFSAVKK